MNLDMDPSQWAEILASNSVAAMQSRLNAQQKKVTDQQSALTALKTALNDFRTALKGFGTNGELVKNIAKSNQEGYVNLKASASASKGLYEVKVTETAAAQQQSFEKMTDDSVKDASGIMKITVGDDKEIEIDLADVNSMAELRDAINKHPDNPGVTASLMKVNGETRMLMGSEKTGFANSFEIDVSGAVGADFQNAITDAKTISEARDAEISIGDMKIKSATNTFKDVIPGVEINVVQKTDPARPLVISVENDEAQTKEQAQKFADAYNALFTTLDELTKSGGDKDKRGALAGDSGLRVLEQQMTSLLRQTTNGKKLSDFGIATDKEGKLEIDSEKFLDAVRDNPSALDAMFGGADGMIKQMDKSLDSFLSTSTGSIKSRQESLDRQNSQLTTKTEQLKQRYDTSYARYLKQFSRAQAAMAQMENTLGSFFSQNKNQ
ncbi:flagellar filament capping protein FliD [Pantoea sp. BIGb0393]|uniref:Flagellar hook-associated protein 2 n=1 Tax=Pantoea nemavictus TaxID=2726955 RepID=A0ABU8PQ39_9GAMM|nr:flagellar filament capping protein FliD [Pantoea nemavictus]MBA0035837.1 flagellar filament capping protein FliD [Pantoea nemavictus]